MSHRFLQACHKQPTDLTPVWFMRQAGRYMAEYQAIRKQHSIVEICKSPELAAEVTMQPIDAFEPDAAIIFADLLLPLEPMGLRFEFMPGEGPVIENPLRDPADVDALSTDNTEDLGYVSEAIRKAVAALDGRVPLIGFTGAPFTLASYMIEGGSSRNYVHAKSMMYGAPDAWAALMAKIVDVLAPFAASQVEAGASVMQVFDSWAGALSPGDYRRYVLPHTRELILRIQKNGVPVTYFGTGTGTILPLMHTAGADVLGLDWRVNLDEAWAQLHHEPAVQGNLDPVALFAPLPELRRQISDVMRRASGRAGHIFNLGHGILPGTPVDNVRAAIEIVREISAR